MSGYGKNPDQYVYDAAATRPNQAPSYPGLAQPSFASQYSDASPRLPHEQSSVEMPYIPSSTYESRAGSGYHADPPFIDARSRHATAHTASEPEITNVVHPSQGTADSVVMLHLRTKIDLNNDPEHKKFAVMFGQKRCEATVDKIDQTDDFYNYALNVQVPPFRLTNHWNPTMMLKLQMQDQQDRVLGEAEAGHFTFTDMSPALHYQSPPEALKKRKFSNDFDEYQDTTAKRANTLRLHAKPRALSGPYSAASASPLPVQPSLSNTYGYSGGYDLKSLNFTPQLSQKSLYAVPSGISLPHADMKPPQMSPNLPSYNQYSSLSHRSPASIAATPTRASVMPSPAALQTPVLVRATTLPQTPANPTGQTFNPYLMYPSKANLKIEGDLDKMSLDWTAEELEAKRRLVQFERSQSGSTITTSFGPVTLETKPARSICVSCILWEEKDECFITSVDTIFLLEQLVNVRFTVEEKNRIRRNLEGFRPLTVSKAKADSEEFFKVIMGFPNPKPRNIEKDVKVFPWKILAHALKKIISKYTASYSSTAGAGSLPAASNAAYVPVGISQATGDLRGNTSPRSAASTTASVAYTPSLSSTTLSPNPRASTGLDVSAAHGLPVSQRDASMAHWGGIASTALPPYASRSSWDYGSYLDAPTAQSMQMPRTEVAPDVGQIPSDTYQHYGQRTTRV